LKAKVTSHDLIDEVTINEEEIVIRFSQGRLKIKADPEATIIEYRAVTEDAKYLGVTPNILYFSTQAMPSEFKIALLSREE
jgi:hypothetical protein